jgi:hypothetical protein
MLDVLGCVGRDIHSVDASLDGNPGIIHVASNVAEDLGLETQLADGLAIQLGLLRRSRRSQFELWCCVS